MDSERKPVVLHQGEGDFLQTQVERVVKADGALTENHFSFTVVTGRAGFGGPPAHRHHRNDEAFFVLEGKFTFLVGDETVDVGPGAFVYVPAGTVHAFTGHGRPDGRLLEIFAPADFEGYFEELAALRADGTWSREKVEALQEKYGMEVVGPPLGETDA